MSYFRNCLTFKEFFQLRKVVGLLGIFPEVQLSVLYKHHHCILPTIVLPPSLYYRYCAKSVIALYHHHLPLPQSYHNHFCTTTTTIPTMPAPPHPTTNTQALSSDGISRLITSKFLLKQTLCMCLGRNTSSVL